MAAKKLARIELEARNQDLSRENYLLNRYFADREFWHLTPTRAQHTDERNETIFDAQWFREDSADDGYVVIKQYGLLQDGRRGNPIGTPEVVSMCLMGLDRVGETRPEFWRYLTEKLRVARFRSLRVETPKEKPMTAADRRELERIQHDMDEPEAWERDTGW